MKHILFLLLSLSVTLVQAQNFEGIITWKITTEITDPKVKAQMEEAQKKMNDPATKAQMKEMQEKMNDPQFKAMMEANPQMKTQLENAMKMMQGGDMSSMLPKGIAVKVKDQNILTKMDGGIMANMETLYLKDKNTAYTIDRESKTYTPLPQDLDDPSASDVETKVTKTNETAKVLNYTCTKYIVEATSKDAKDGKMQQFFWTTTEIKDLDFKSLANQRLGKNKQALFYDKLEGVPLKMEMTMPQGRMVMEATEVKKQSLSAAEFAIPAGFKEVALK